MTQLTATEYEILRLAHQHADHVRFGERVEDTVYNFFHGDVLALAKDIRTDERGLPGAQRHAAFDEGYAAGYADGKLLGRSSRMWDTGITGWTGPVWRAGPDDGHVVVTRGESGAIESVTRQNDEGEVLSVIAVAHDGDTYPPRLSRDEWSAAFDALLRDHGPEDREPDCPACTAREKIGAYLDRLDDDESWPFPSLKVSISDAAAAKQAPVADECPSQTKWRAQLQKNAELRARQKKRLELEAEVSRLREALSDLIEGAK